ncbi:MAG TPA: diguanylate cyclase [Gaiellaceae bacterium]|nr:diguanylate cyclase [Gaiellaceae bacterium]
MQRTICGLRPGLFAYVVATCALAVPLLALSLIAIALQPPAWSTALPVVLFFALALISDLRPVPMSGSGSDEVSISSVFIVATAVLFGARYAVLLAAASIAISVLVARLPRERAAFNIAMYAISAAAAALPAAILGPTTTSGLRLTAYVFLGGATHLMANVVLVAGAISLSRRVPYAKVVVPGLRQGGAAFAIMAFLAALAANLWVLEPLLLVLLAGPLFTLTLYQRSALHSRIAHEAAQTDNLTGLGNHRAYQAALREQLEDARRTGTPLALCLVDVDNFKHINDINGHPAGDEVLVLLAKLLAKPEHSHAFRFGGDEFAVLFSLDEMSAYRQIDMIQRELGQTDLPTGPVTISAGIASFPQHAGAVEDLQKTADGALYWSKHHGKNRSCIYSPGVVRIYSSEELERETERTARLRAAKNLVRFVDARDPSTADHSQLVSALAEALGAELGVDAETLDHLRLAGLLHDLGKIGLPDSILGAPRGLTPDEYAIVKRHPEFGYALLDGLGLQPVDGWVLHHHEHWDGSGYPNGLSGIEIPLGARIILVADAFEAITADRPYRRAQSEDAALTELRSAAGSQFDPNVVEALERYLAARSSAVRVAVPA